MESYSAILIEQGKSLSEAALEPKLAIKQMGEIHSKNQYGYNSEIGR